MVNKILTKWKKWSLNGIHLPFIHDPSTNSPSITLMFPYITFVLSLCSVIALHFKIELFVATATTLLFWVVSMILYLIRRISKAKFDLDDKTFELEGEADGGKKE